MASSESPLATTELVSVRIICYFQDLIVRNLTLCPLSIAHAQDHEGHYLE